MLAADGRAKLVILLCNNVVLLTHLLHFLIDIFLCILIFEDGEGVATCVAVYFHPWIY